MSLPASSLSNQTVSKPTLVSPGDDPEPSFWKLWPLLISAVVIPRALLFAFNENYLGDAVARTELAMRWAANPHVLTSFRDGAYQYGPLHLYLVGLALKLGLAKPDAGRWVSLFCGAVSVVPLYLFSRRLFGWRAAIASSLGFAAWGLHLQASTTAASEALGVLLFLGVAWQLSRGVQRGTFSPLFWAALGMNLLTAVRYDAWFMIPLLAALLFFYGRDRVAGATRAVTFGLMCLPFVLAWMQGNEMATGEALYPLRYIDAFHRTWAQSEIAWKGQGLFRLEGLFFWPSVAMVSLSPLVAALGMAGMAVAWKRRPELRWVILWALVPTVLYALRSAVLLSFVPMARFAMNQLVLLLPFVAYGYSAVVGVRRRWAGFLKVATVGLAVLTPVGLAAFTFHRQSRASDALFPLSPLTQNPIAVRQVAQFARTQLSSGRGTLLLDTDAHYLDMQAAFFSDLPETQMARFRWQPQEGEQPNAFSFDERLKASDVQLLMLSESGELQKDSRFRRDGDAVWFNNQRFVRLAGFEAPLSVYRAD